MGSKEARSEQGQEPTYNSTNAFIGGRNLQGYSQL